MRKSMAVVCVVVMMVMGIGHVTWGGAGEEGDVLVLVSPQTLVQNSEVPVVTVHVAIPYRAVDLSTVDMNGLAPDFCKPDLQGNLVAKFKSGRVMAIVSPPSATLTLTCETINGPFSGSDTVRVIGGKK